MWDAENRLAAVEPASTPQNGDKRVEFTYDYLGRRVQKQVFAWNAGTEQWDLTLTRRFVWSGWLMLMELDGSNNAVRSYTCGLDLAGQNGLVNDLQSAGGIGGVLAVHDASSSEDYVYCYDANGNVGQMIAWEAGYGNATGDGWHSDRLVARYEYDPYGAIVGPDTDDDGDFDEYDEPGTYAAPNPFRFSTKYWDDETGLGCWPIRYYDPRLGRWISRDPIGEADGAPLYRYAGNEPVAVSDGLGLQGTSHDGGQSPQDPPEVSIPLGIPNPCPTDMYACKHTLNSFPPKAVNVRWEDPVGSFLWIFKDSPDNQWQHSASGSLPAAWERIEDASTNCLGKGDKDDVTLGWSETNATSTNWKVAGRLQGKHWRVVAESGGSTSNSTTVSRVRTFTLLCNDECTQHRRFYYQLYHSGTVPHLKKRRWMWRWTNVGTISIKVYSGDLGWIECCKKCK